MKGIEMGALTGLRAIGNYAGAASDSAAVDILLNLIPNPDAPHGTGAVARNQGGGHLDEMSPGAAAQLRVEILALRDAVDGNNTL
jgi:hypothetical protein